MDRQTIAGAGEFGALFKFPVGESAENSERLTPGLPNVASRLLRAVRALES